jgi:hypothetical protein
MATVSERYEKTGSSHCSQSDPISSHAERHKAATLLDSTVRRAIGESTPPIDTGHILWSDGVTVLVDLQEPEKFIGPPQRAVQTEDGDTFQCSEDGCIIDVERQRLDVCPHRRPSNRRQRCSLSFRC